MRPFLFFLIPALALLKSAPSVSASGASVLTHGTDFARVSPARWVAEGWRVSEPDPGAVLVDADGGTAFVITTPNTAMSWTLTTEPVWTDPFDTLALSYFVEGVAADSAGVFIELFDGSTGPITPGATNTENPLASGGRFACGEFAPGLHVALVDLGAVANLERVAEITVTVRSGAEPVAVRFNQMTFLARPEGSGSGVPLEAAAPDSPDFESLTLPREALAPSAAAAVALGLAAVWTPGPLVAGGLPFELEEAAACTPLNRGGAITLAGPARGDRLALLLGARLWGNAEGWYSAGAAAPRRLAPGAHQFRLVLRYEDGTVTSALPRRAADDVIGLAHGLDVYAVALEPGKTLSEVTCVEEMSYGQVMVLGASVLGAETSRDPEDEKDERVGTDELEIAEGMVREEPERVKDEARFLAGYDYVLGGVGLDLYLDADGVVQLMLGGGGHSWMREPSPLVSLVDASGAASALHLLEAMDSPERDRLVLVWAVGDTPHRLELALAAREEGGLTCAATLSNGGDAPWPTSLRLPAMQGLQSIGGKPLTYMLGARSAINDTAPIEVAEVYGGRFPLQFMDVYDAAGGGGLACLVLDETLRRKWFEYRQDDTGRASMSVGYRDLELAPGERLSLPPAVLLSHTGDWRGPFQQYKAWVQQRFPRMRPNGMQDLFYCRRDYPLGGTTYLYDVAKPGYSYEKLISEGEWAFGGVDMVDISGWAYNEAIGRVGTYLKNDLGGLEALAAGVRAGHELGAQTGLYFEGYLLDKRAATAAEGLASWQLIRAGGEPAWWPGEMEFFCCPGAPGWRDKLASDIAAVAAAVGADAVYVDQLGILDPGKECWSEHHGHPVPSNPIVEEIGLLARIRAVLDRVQPDCAIYIEHLPCDAMTPYIDGAFNMGMKHTRHALGPTKLPLHRYLTPEVPIFEMVAHGIRPIPAEADDLKLSFFHGMGLWLKGRGGSWYSEGFRALAPRFHAVLREYSAFFRSPDAEPHVDTLHAGVYANRFPLGDRVLYTLYNANAETVSGPVLALDAGSTVTSLYRADPLTLTNDGGALFATGFFPEEVAAVLVAP